MEAFGLPKGTYHIRVNSESIDLRKNYVLSTLLPYEVELASTVFHKVIVQCFMNESADITGIGVKLFNCLRQLNMRPLQDGIEESIATRVFTMLLQDSIDLTMYRYLRSSGITKPKDLIGVSAATIREIVTRLNNRSISKLVDQYLRFLSPRSAVGVRDVVIWLMSECNGAIIGNTETLGASNRMTRQLGDIESNQYYQIELVGVPSLPAYKSEALDGDFGDAALHEEPVISTKDSATTSDTLDVAQNGNDSPAAPSVPIEDASRSSRGLIDLFRANPKRIIPRTGVAAANDAHNHDDDIEWISKP
jgi:hypothetical protein